jgi:arginine deiminase
MDLSSAGPAREDVPALPRWRRAEWDPVGAAIVCEPGFDSLAGALRAEPTELLGEFDLETAQFEHRMFRKALEGKGIRVIEIHEILTDADLSRLRRIATGSLVYDIDPRVDPLDRYSAGVLHQLTIESLETRALVDLIMLTPVVKISPGAQTGGPLSAAAELHPLRDAFSLRNSVIITATGPVIGRAWLDGKQPEHDLAELVLRRLGVESTGRIAPPGTVAGGDHIPAGSVVFQARGLLSDDDGIGQLLDSGAFGGVDVAVIHDAWAQMEPIPLDTYFTVLGPSLVALRSDRTGNEEPEVELWVVEGSRHGRRYVRARRAGMRVFLAERGFEVMSMSGSECDALGANGLLVGATHYMCTSEAAVLLGGRLRSRGIVVEPLDASALAPACGGPRRWAQVL